MPANEHEELPAGVESGKPKPRGLADTAVRAAPGVLFVLLGAAVVSIAGTPAFWTLQHSGAHSDLEEPVACLDCHVPFVGTPSSRCLAPGCHDVLATGAPRRSGPAMPVRFHVAVRNQSCRDCHAEHDGAGDPPFHHGRLGAGLVARCRSCHSGAGVPTHAETDSVPCSVCHAMSAWRGASASHDRVVDRPCESCHPRPDVETHPEVTGACRGCHQSRTWKVHASVEK